MAALAVIGIRAGLPPEAVLAPMAIYVVDTGTTLVVAYPRRRVVEPTAQVPRLSAAHGPGLVPWFDRCIRGVRHRDL